MDLERLGEFGLIEALRRRAGTARPPWRVGIGDDAAVLRPRPGRDLVMTADALVENVHFRWSTGARPRLLGRKALRVNLSDLGAMGARPVGFLLSLGVPPDVSPDRLDGFVAGLIREASDSDCPLVGGDSVRSAVWQLSLTAIGEVPRGKALRRGAGRPGQRLMVTGALGASALGLHVLEHGGPRNASEKRFVRAHELPDPPYRAGPRLARAGLAAAAIDVSDGLLRDLGQLAAASGLGADVHLDRLPLAHGFAVACSRRGVDPLELACRGGEDYQLLFSVPASAPPAADLGRRIGCSVREIGHLRRGRGLRGFVDGRRVPLGPGTGFEHFGPAGAGA